MAIEIVIRSDLIKLKGTFRPLQRSNNLYLLTILLVTMILSNLRHNNFLWYQKNSISSYLLLYDLITVVILDIIYPYSRQICRGKTLHFAHDVELCPGWQNL